MSISIQKRGKRWTASVRLNGHVVTSTFDLKEHARTWTERVRREILSAHAEGRTFNPDDHKIIRRRLKLGEPISHIEIVITQDDIDADQTPRPDWTVKRAFKEYNDTVVETLSGWRQARSRIEAWRKQDISLKRLDELTAEDVAGWMSSRRKVKKLPAGEPGKPPKITHVPVSPSTLRNDIYRLSALYELAIAPKTKGGWGLELSNPVTKVALPPLQPGRQRRLDHGLGGNGGESEHERMTSALMEGLDGPEMASFFILALETGMRRSEILDLRAQEVRSTQLGRVIERPSSKNGHPRRVVLSNRATAIVDQLRNAKTGKDKLFTLNADAIATRWDIAREKAGCPDLRLHDIRHEALSRMADKGLSVGALASQSGHRTMQTLLRYVNASETDIRKKLE